MSMILPAFLAFAAAVGLADIVGPGHQAGGLVLLTGWFLGARLLPPRAWRGLLTAALTLSVAIAALAVVQGINSGFIPPARARGPFASPNFLGAYAVLMFFLATIGGCASQSGHFRRLRHRASGNGGLATGIKSGIPVVANLLSLALSQSRGAILALGAGLAVMSLGAVKRHWMPLAAVACCCASLAAALVIRPGADEARGMIWRLGWQAALQRPLTGWGQGGLVINGLDRFYSIPLEVFIESGLLGVAAGCVLIAAAVRAAKGQPTIHAFLAAWFVQGLFLFSIPATSVLLVTVLAYLGRRGRARQDGALGAGGVLKDEVHLGPAGEEAVRPQELRLAVVGEAEPVEEPRVGRSGEIGEAPQRRPGDRRCDGDTQGNRPDKRPGDKRRDTVHGSLQG